MAAPSSLHDEPDDELVRRAQSGEREAFAEIYNRYHAVVYRFARMMSGSAAIGEDVTQEAFTVFLRELHRYEPKCSRISTYLYGVAQRPPFPLTCPQFPPDPVRCWKRVVGMPSCRRR
jgi:RNA polymerase sigma-70 factor (ECF subfamily)